MRINVGPCHYGGACTPVLGKTQLHDLIIAFKGERKCSRSSKERMLSPGVVKEDFLWVSSTFLRFILACRSLRPQLPHARGSTWNRRERWACTFVDGVERPPPPPPPRLDT